MAKKAEKDWPRTVAFGSGRVRIALRSSGDFALSWRELGATRRTTKVGEKNALAWAAEKARTLDDASGRQWVHAGERDSLAMLRTIAGDGEGAVRRLLEDVTGARTWLDGAADLTTAARWYAENGPLKVKRTTAAVAIARFLAEYKSAPKATRTTFTTELDGFSKKFPAMMLMELDEGRLFAWVHRQVGAESPESPAPRTLRNRITTWVTFLNRSRDWGLLPPGKHAGDLLRKPTIPDAGKAILSIDQGRALLAAVRKREPKLEAYLLIAGWLGLRPSEVQRLTWGGFEWDRGYLHVSAAVAGKTSSERYVPVDARLMARMREIFLASKKKPAAKVCGFRSREFLSVLAREEKILESWPPDVLRHSFCSYRIAVVKSLDEVANEAGNSPAILKSNYRKPLRAEDGALWWDLL